MTVTLKQMAAHLNVSTKTFTKYVALYNIPHIKLGRSCRFDIATVEAWLRAVPVTQTVVQFQPVRQRRTISKFGEAIGL